MVASLRLRVDYSLIDKASIQGFYPFVNGIFVINRLNAVISRPRR